MIICDNERLDESSFLVSRVRLKKNLFLSLKADEDAKSRPVIRERRNIRLSIFFTTPFFVRDFEILSLHGRRQKTSKMPLSCLCSFLLLLLLN